jgi:hypothetical protein
MRHDVFEYSARNSMMCARSSGTLHVSEFPPYSDVTHFGDSPMPALTPEEVAFEREKLCYQQNSEHARGLNTQMNAIPAFAVTLTGGLWYAAGLTDKLDHEIRFALLIIAGFSDAVLILAAYRVRDVFQSHLDKLEAFSPKDFASGHPTHPRVGAFGSYSMISMYCVLMGMGSVMSFIGAFHFYWPFVPALIPCGIALTASVALSSWVSVNCGIAIGLIAAEWCAIVTAFVSMIQGRFLN